MEPTPSGETAPVRESPASAPIGSESRLPIRALVTS